MVLKQVAGIGYKKKILIYKQGILYNLANSLLGIHLGKRAKNLPERMWPLWFPCPLQVCRGALQHQHLWHWEWMKQRKSRNTVSWWSYFSKLKVSRKSLFLTWCTHQVFQIGVCGKIIVPGKIIKSECQVHIIRDKSGEVGIILGLNSPCQVSVVHRGIRYLPSSGWHPNHLLSPKDRQV